LIHYQNIFKNYFVEKRNRNPFNSDVSIVLLRKVFCQFMNKVSLYYRTLQNEEGTKEHNKYRAQN